MIQQLFTATMRGPKVVKMCFLLPRHQQIHKLIATILMEETHRNKEIIDINKSIAQIPMS